MNGKKICSVEGCQKIAKAKGFCIQHYKCWHRLGKPVPDRPTFHGTEIERLEHYTDKKGHDDCWLWLSNKDKDGYGTMRSGSKNKRAHRVAYEHYIGKIPKGKLVLHSCNNPSCVNPNHLRVGVHNDNMRDRFKAGNYTASEKHPNSKFSNKIVEKVRVSVGSYAKIGKLFNMSATQVGNIKRGDQRKNG